MPTYEYKCTKCGRVFELFQSITAKPKKWIECECAKCDNRAPVKRLIGAGAGVLCKGSGFYQTDYRSESYRNAAKKEQESAKSASESKKDAGSTAGDKSKPKSGKESTGGGSGSKSAKS